ncbi:MAG: hypothetical protein KDA88_19740 [Planctomycetaceae bacterium]|nr:hypothetical protein [Planctomycetaceae bacterium]MCB9952286.1 hypothetical protein [Planctomycetaceae bacterium]
MSDNGETPAVSEVRLPTAEEEVRRNLVRMLVFGVVYFVLSSILGGASDLVAFAVRAVAFGILFGVMLLVIPKPRDVIIPDRKDLEIPGIWPRFRPSRPEGRTYLTVLLIAGGIVYWLFIEWTLMSLRTAPPWTIVYAVDVAVWGGMLLAAIWCWNEPYLRSEGLLTVSPAGLLFASFPDTSFPSLIPWADLKKSEIVEHRGWKAPVELALWHRPGRRVLTVQLPRHISDEELESLEYLLNTYLDQSDRQQTVKAPAPKRQFHRLLERLGKKGETHESSEGLMTPEPRKPVIELTEDQFLDLVFEDTVPIEITEFEVPDDEEPTADLPFDDENRPPRES